MSVKTKEETRLIIAKEVEYMLNRIKSQLDNAPMWSEIRITSLEANYKHTEDESLRDFRYRTRTKGVAKR